MLVENRRLKGRAITTRYRTNGYTNNNLTNRRFFLIFREAIFRKFILSPSIARTGRIRFPFLITSK